MESSWHEVLKAKTLREREEERKGEERDICTEKERRKDVTTWIFLYRNCEGFPERDRPGKESLEKENLGEGINEIKRDLVVAPVTATPT